MINDDEVITLPHGEIAYIANYKKQLLPEYNGNPLIEALPKILSKEEYIDAVTKKDHAVTDTSGGIRQPDARSPDAERTAF